MTKLKHTHTTLTHGTNNVLCFDHCSQQTSYYMIEASSLIVRLKINSSFTIIDLFVSTCMFAQRKRNRTNVFKKKQSEGIHFLPDNDKF